MRDGVVYPVVWVGAVRGEYGRVQGGGGYREVYNGVQGACKATVQAAREASSYALRLNIK